MPLYDFVCDVCELEVEILRSIDAVAPSCPKCGAEMRKKPTFPAMVKMKGEGGYPSRRKQWRGSAPYTRGYDNTRDKNSEFYRGQA